MDRLLVTASVVAGLLVWGSPGLVIADADAEAAAIAAIEKLGGTVREIALGSNDRVVEFHLRGQALDDDGLAHVAVLNNVVSLNLRNTGISSAGLVHLNHLTQLRRLHLEMTGIDDDGIVHLGKLTNLRYLNLYGTKVTDKALENLKGLKRLRRLYVWQTDVTDEGVARLNTVLPELTIVRGADLSNWPKSDSEPAKPLEWIPAGDVKPPKSNPGSNTAVTFENKSSRRVKIYWIGYGGEQKLYGELDPGETRFQNTYSEATWLITDADDKPLGHFVAEAYAARAEIPDGK